MEKFGKTEQGTYVIRADAYAELCGMIRKLTARTKRTGGAGVAVEKVREGYVCTREVFSDGISVGVVVAAVEVRVLGEVPRVDGWEFVARVDHEGAAVVVCRSPGCAVDLPSSLWSASAQVCDHCGVRRPRKQTYVLVDASGELKRVGSTCLKDFFGLLTYRSRSRGIACCSSLSVWAGAIAITGLMAVAQVALRSRPLILWLLRSQRFADTGG